jgi:hypothetical protein
MSLGGYFAARAAALEHRLRGAVFFDGVYDFHESLWALVLKEAIAAYEAGNFAQCEQIVSEKMVANTALSWVVTQGTWSFRVSGVVGLIDRSRQCSLAGTVDQIRCPYLVMEAKGDISH